MSRPERSNLLKHKEGAGSSFIGPNFTNLGIIGSGSYGEVYKVRHNETKKIYAIKTYKHIFNNPVLALRTLRQICILRRINNQRIIKVFDIIPPTDFNNFNTLSVVLQYLPYDLKKICEKSITLKDDHITKILYQLLIGLRYLKNIKILHRDLKPQNILTDQDFNIKICDFGLARPNANQFNFTSAVIKVQDKKQQIPERQTPTDGAFTPQPKKPQKQMTCHVVSRWYRAPQLILMQTKYDSAIEMWSVGCILGQLISEHEKNKKIGKIPQSRKPLFEGKACFPLSPPKDNTNPYKMENGFPHSEDDQIMKIIKIIGTPTAEEVSFIEEEKASDYIKSLPKYEKKKPTSMFEHCLPEWQDLLNKTLLFDPRKRCSIEQALSHPLFDSIRNQKDLQCDMDDLGLHLPTDMEMQDIKNIMIEEIKFYQKKVQEKQEKQEKKQSSQ